MQSQELHQEGREQFGSLVMTFSGLGIVKLFKASCMQVRDFGVGVRALLEKQSES